MMLMFGKHLKRLHCLEFSAVCRKKGEIGFLHTASGVLLTG